HWSDFARAVTTSTVLVDDRGDVSVKSDAGRCLRAVGVARNSSKRDACDDQSSRSQSSECSFHSRPPHGKMKEQVRACSTPGPARDLRLPSTFRIPAATPMNSQSRYLAEAAAAAFATFLARSCIPFMLSTTPLTSPVSLLTKVTSTSITLRK